MENVNQSVSTGAVIRCVRWIRKNIIDPDTRLPAVNIIYAIIAMAFLLHHIPLTLYYPRYLTITYAVNRYYIIAFAVLSVILGRLWKDVGFWLLLALFALKTISYRFESGSFGFFGELLYDLGICYAVGRVLTGDRRRKFLLVFCCIWTIAMSVLSVLSIHVSWTKEPILNFVQGGAIGFEDGYRLSPIYYCVQASVIASASIAVAMAGFFMVKKWFWKALFVTGMVLIFIMGILTVTRTNHITNAFMLALFAVMLVYQRIRKLKKWHIACLSLMGIVILAGFTYLQSFGIRIFNALNQSGGLLISRAYADGELAIAARDIDLNNGMNGVLNGRWDIWRSIFLTFKEKPIRFLLGTGFDNPMGPVNELRASLGMFRAAHAHNPWIQMFLENGIPAFLLYLVFTLYVVWGGLKQIFRKEIPFWQRLVPLVVLVCFVGDLADITGHPDRGLPGGTILYFFSGLTIAFYHEGKAKKKKQQGLDEVKA